MGQEAMDFRRYTRNDFFLATIGWAGFFTTSLQLIMSYGR
jgi:hypothetical protein